MALPWTLLIIVLFSISATAMVANATLLSGGILGGVIACTYTSVSVAGTYNMIPLSKMDLFCGASCTSMLVVVAQTNTAGLYTFLFMSVAYAMSGRGNRGRGGGGGHGGSGGRSRLPASGYINLHRPVGAHSNDASPAHERESSTVGRRNSEIASVEGVARKFSGMSTSDHGHGPRSTTREVGDISDHGHGSRFSTSEVGDIADHGHGPGSATHEVGDISPNFGSSKSAQNDHISEYRTPKPYLPSVRDQGYATAFPSLSSHSGSSATSIEIVQSGDAKEENRTPSHFSCTPPVDATRKENKAFQTLGSASQEREIQSGKSASEKTSGNMEFENSESFDICEERNRNVVKLKAPLLATNRAKRNEAKRLMERDNIKILRPGMILLKGYLPLVDQVKLVKSCRNLGRGSGGFYQPGYHDGATLHLKMMCLGKNWDPQTSSYGDERSIDGAKPPPIPNEFQRFVKEAIQDCHDYLESHSKVKNAKDILPSMSPNICIINFYSKTGKLGLHKDKDESQESLKKGLPVVSFSIGDYAEFLYGDQRDIEKADKVVLESGDVLIFGGKSRNIFHGVTSIVPNTAPKPLLEGTDLKPGRLNLTFREY
ncbi:hypothetical protein BUALT_Bualt07G0168300 [Buddleja alternifolia]|uniref:DNA N(6)-methyladenine demethylase n=1 Tax=Buddleja alternifolia TaxID=168488 RepID=A0AAV6XBH8_9LAMI|nr:hypothetical protein BUALT_Bualt07G0168300 [Buddleja alternifolia]